MRCKNYFIFISPVSDFRQGLEQHQCTICEIINVTAVELYLQAKPDDNNFYINCARNREVKLSKRFRFVRMTESCELLLIHTICLLAVCWTTVDTRAVLNFSNHKHFQQSRIDAVKQDILDKLGLQQVPDVSRVNASTTEMRRMLQLYRRSLPDTDMSLTVPEDQEQSAEKNYSFHYGGQSSVTSQLVWHSRNVLRLFSEVDIPVPDDAHREIHVRSANLVLNLSGVLAGNNSLPQAQLRVSVFQLLQPVKTARTSSSRKLLQSRVMSSHPTQQETFIVTEAVQDWINTIDSNHGLEIHFEEQSPTGWSGDVPDLSSTPMSPIVYVQTQERSILNRSKRSAPKEDCTQGDGERKCCRFPLQINFQDIGWGDWIVAPPSYQAYFCDGQCPNEYKTAHYFATIKSLIHRANPAAIPAPCCTATRRSPLSLLHYNEQRNLVVTLYEDMVVDECRCA